MEYLNGQKPSMGQRMLLRRAMQESLDGLKNLKFGRESYDIYKEALARLYTREYHIRIEEGLVARISGGFPINRKLVEDASSQKIAKDPTYKEAKNYYKKGKNAHYAACGSGGPGPSAIGPPWAL